MSLKVGDRVSENGRKGTVTAFHTKGTVDVKFDDMDYAIRRQMGQVRKANPSKKSYVTSVPLVIACSATKTSSPGKEPAYERYQGPLWQSFRKCSAIPNPNIKVMVLSAKYGFLDYDTPIPDYNMVLVKEGKRSRGRHEVYPSELAKQIAVKGNKRPTVIFVGGKLYREALEMAGYRVLMLEDADAFPDRDKHGGMGLKRSALCWYLDFLSTYENKKKNPPQFDYNRIQYALQVQAIYESLVKKALGLKSKDDFGRGNRRIDYQLTQPERRTLLSRAFAITTNFQRKHGYLEPSPMRGQPFPLLITEKTLKRIQERFEDPDEVVAKLKKYERTLKMARKRK